MNRLMLVATLLCLTNSGPIVAVQVDFFTEPCRQKDPGCSLSKRCEESLCHRMMDGAIDDALILRMAQNTCVPECIRLAICHKPSHPESSQNLGRFIAKYIQARFTYLKRIGDSSVFVSELRSLFNHPFSRIDEVVEIVCEHLPLDLRHSLGKALNLGSQDLERAAGKGHVQIVTLILERRDFNDGQAVTAARRNAFIRYQRELFAVASSCIGSRSQTRRLVLFERCVKLLTESAKNPKNISTLWWLWQKWLDNVE